MSWNCTKLWCPSARAAFQHCWTEEHLLATASDSQGQGRNYNRNSCPAGTEQGLGRCQVRAAASKCSPVLLHQSKQAQGSPQSLPPHSPASAREQGRLWETSQQLIAKTCCSYLSSSDAYLMTNKLHFVVKQAAPLVKGGRYNPSSVTFNPLSRSG